MKQDLQIFDLIRNEKERQSSGLELIASENYVSDYVLEAMGSICTNKYAEGYPGKRYYGGCQIVDQIEQLAIDRLCKIYDAEYANVQPHSGAQANMAVIMACLKPGDTFMGLALSQGGHLTHGSPVNASGILYHAVAYGLNEETGMIDYDKMEATARECRPKLIIGGASAYPVNGTMKGCAPSPTRWEPSFGSIWPTQLASSPRVCSRTLSSTPTS